MSGQTNKDLDEVRHAFEVWRWTKREIAELTEKQKEARSIIENHFGQTDSTVVGELDGRPALRWGWANDSKFDRARFTEDHPDINLDDYKIRGRHREMKEIEDE